MVFDPTVTPKKAGFIFRSLPVLGVFALLHGGVFAVQDVKTQPNPYLAISERNAFDLTDAPPPAKDTPTPELPKNLDLKFTGIYRLKGVEKACLALIDSSAKPPETKYLQIPVGDKQGAIEITAIDAEAGTVNLIKDGSPLELSLKNNEHTYKTAVARAPSKSSKSRSSSSKTSSSGSRPTTGRSSGTTSSRPGSSPSRTSSSRSGSVSSLGGTRTTRAVPTRARRTYPTPPHMEGGDPAVQALEMMHQKDLAESKGVPMPPLPFQQQLEDAPPADAIRDDRPPMPPVPGGPIPPGG